MKTTMQELIDKIQYSIDVQSGVSLTETQVNTLKAVMLVAENLLEKEKEQIIEARDGRETSSFTTGKDYYDLNFNHHIESEPNSYTNFTPHNADEEDDNYYDDYGRKIEPNEALKKAAEKHKKNKKK
jgi:hypothetical protein